MKKIMLSCKEVVKKISSKEKATWRIQMQIRLHLFMCHHCGKYEKHLKILETSVKSFFVSENQKLKSEDVVELENKIIEKFKIN